MIESPVRAAVVEGRARVLLELRVRFTPEGDLPSAEAVAAQRRTIDKIRQQVLARLARTTFSVSRPFTSIPILALHIGADALSAWRGWAIS